MWARERKKHTHRGREDGGAKVDLVIVCAPAPSPPSNIP